MGFDVDEIIAHINRNAPARAHRYEARIFAKTIENDASRDIMFNCSEISVPGSNLQFSQIKRYGIGLTSNVIEGKNFPEIQMTFYESEFEAERKYFFDWHNTIMDPVSMRLKFYKDYVRDIQVLQYNVQGQVVYEAVLRDCIPTNIGALNRGYDKGETVAQFNVNIVFQDIIETYYVRS